MRHRAKNRQLSRTSEHRRALLSNMATSLFLHGKIVTTVAKAKELRPVAEKMITLARRGDLHARRLVERRIKDKDASGKLFKEYGPRFAARPGGYTRIIKLGGSRQMEKADGRWVYNRLGDNGRRAIWELVVRAEPKPEAEGKTKEKKAKEEKAAAAT
jgi:large subunit ribosomal protein L17